MSNILSIETSTAACSVALAVGEEVQQRHALAAREHAQLVLPWVEALLAEAGLQLNQLDAIAVGRGPGGFTGIRIGMGIAQGLALGADLPVIPVSSLQVLAQTTLAKFNATKVLVAQDARMKEVYWAAYVQDDQGLMQPQIEDQLCLPDRIECPTEKTEWAAVGDAWNVYETAMCSALKEMPLKKIPDVFPEARYLSTLASYLYSQGLSVSPDLALPRYLRGKEAWVVNI